MKLDLSDLENWDDADLMQALNDIERGLSPSDTTWIDRYTQALEDVGHLSERQREVAEDILRRWNSRQ